MAFNVSLSPCDAANLAHVSCVYYGWYRSNNNWLSRHGNSRRVLPSQQISLSSCSAIIVQGCLEWQVSFQGNCHVASVRRWNIEQANVSSVSPSSERMTKGSRSGEGQTFRRCLGCIFILIRRHIWIQGYWKMKKPSSDLSAAVNNLGDVCWWDHRGNNQSTTENLKPRRGAKLLPHCISFFHSQPKECLEGCLFIIVTVVMSRFCNRICRPFRFNFSPIYFARTSVFYTLMRAFSLQNSKGIAGKFIYLPW